MIAVANLAGQLTCAFVHVSFLSLSNLKGQNYAAEKAWGG